jgi:hypothetical protein
MIINRRRRFDNLLNLLIEIEEENADFLGTLDQLEIGTWLIPGVGSDGGDDAVVRVGGGTDCSEVVRHLLDVSLESLEGDEALMLLIVRVLLKTENTALINIPLSFSLSENIGSKSVQGGHEVVGGSRDCSHSDEESCEEFHLYLFLSNYFLLLL